MNTGSSTANPTPANVAVSRTPIALLLVLCGVACTAARAATPQDEVPRIIVTYDAHSLTTDAGAKSVYRRLVRAAEKVCPDMRTGSRLPGADTLACRREAVARAVHEINNAKLAALSDRSPRSG